MENNKDQNDDIVIMESTDAEKDELYFDIEEKNNSKQLIKKQKKSKKKSSIDPLLQQIILALIVCSIIIVIGLNKITSIEQDLKNKEIQKIQKNAEISATKIANKIKILQNKFKSLELNNLSSDDSITENKIYPGSKTEYFKLPFDNFSIVDDPEKGNGYLNLLLQIKTSKPDNISAIEIINLNNENISIIFAKKIVNNEKKLKGIAVSSIPIEYKSELIKNLDIDQSSIIIKQGNYIIIKVLNPKLNPKNSLTKIVSIKNTHWKIEYSNLSKSNDVDEVKVIMSNWIILIYLIIGLLCLLFSIFTAYKYIKKLKQNLIKEKKSTSAIENLLLDGKESISNLRLNKSEVLTDKVIGQTLSEDTDESIENQIIDPIIFTEYGIRGKFGKQINAKLMTKLAHAIAQEMENTENTKITIGYDGRHSSEVLYQALINGFKPYQIYIIALDLSTLPVIYYCAITQTNGCALMITAGSSPGEINGFKLILNNKIVSKEKLKSFAEVEVENGKEKYQIQKQNINHLYINSITEQFNYKKTLKIVVDTSNGVASLIIFDLLKLLGCNLIPINKEIDGKYPSHSPNPTKPENCSELSERVKKESADLGIIFNGDGSSIGIVSSTGDIIWADRLLMLLAREILKNNVGAKIIFDVKSTSQLHDWIIKYQGDPQLSPSGYSAIKQRMDINKALLGGEFSGHFFLATHANGLDDGFYMVARICQIIANYKSSSSNLFKEIPEKISTPEILIGVQPGQLNNIIDKIISQKEEFLPAGIISIDGIRVEYEDGWGLVRASKTTSSLCLRFEADNPQVLQRIAEKFKEVILSVVFVKFPY